MTDLRKIASRLDDLLGGWIEQYSIIEQTEDRLVLAATFDSCYYHNLEVEFTGLAFSNCPQNFRATGVHAIEGAEKTAVPRPSAEADAVNVVGVIEARIFCFGSVQVPVE